MEETKPGRQGDQCARIYSVHALNTLQETEHTLRSDSGSRWIALPFWLTKSLSSCCVCPSVCLKYVLYGLFVGLCTLRTPAYLSFCLPDSWEYLGIFICRSLSVCVPPCPSLPMPFQVPISPFSCLPGYLSFLHHVLLCRYSKHSRGWGQPGGRQRIANTKFPVGILKTRQ